MNLPTLTDAQAALERYFNFSRFREGQAEVISALFSNSDVIVVMPTGGGKSLCYQLPALLLPGTTIVVSPLIALMKDQVDALVAREIPATLINSSLPLEEQRARLRAMQQGKYKLVYIAPERFRNERFVEAIRGVEVSLFAVDEAHCISQWGHDFRPDYLRLKEAVAQLGQNGKNPQVIALTATATPAVRADIAKQLALNDPVSFTAGFDRHNLTLRVVQCKNEHERMARAAQIAEQATGAGIIYAATRKTVEEVTGHLQQRGIKALAYHAGLSEQTRSRVQERFMAGELTVIVATNAFGMGIDKRDLRFVTHYNAPGSIEAYYQEVGRAGRDGLPSVCTLLFNYIDKRVHEFFIEGSNPSPEIIQRVYDCLVATGLEIVRLSPKEIAERLHVKNDMAVNAALIVLEKAGHLARVQGMDEERWRGAQLLDVPPVQKLRVDWAELQKQEAADRRKLREMLDFAYHEQCLRRYILKYFGDVKEVTGCRCSNCQPGQFTAAGEAGEGKGKGKRAKKAAAPATAEPLPPLPPPLPVGPRALSAHEHLAVRKILSCIARVDGKFGKGTIASVLRGSKAKNLQAHQLDQLSTFGMLGEYSQDELTRFINALIVAGCVTQSSGAYPTVSLTALGKEVMHDRTRVELDLEGVEADTSEDFDAIADVKPRSETHEQTYELYKSGLGLAEIAEQRGLKALTIEQHVAELIEQGRDVRVEDFVNEVNRALIESAAQEHGLEKLRPLKDVLPESISYAEIRLVVARLRWQQTQASEAASAAN
jgi:ATP-dependent DNA helicase RecQ